MKPIVTAALWLMMAAMVSAAPSGARRVLGSPRDYYNTKAVLRGQVDVTDELTYGRHMTLGGILEKLLGERPSETLDRWLSDNGRAGKPASFRNSEELPAPKPMTTSVEGQVKTPR